MTKERERRSKEDRQEENQERDTEDPGRKIPENKDGPVCREHQGGWPGQETERGGGEDTVHPRIQDKSGGKIRNAVKAPLPTRRTGGRRQMWERRLPPMWTGRTGRKNKMQEEMHPLRKHLHDMQS